MSLKNDLLQLQLEIESLRDWKIRRLEDNIFWTLDFGFCKLDCGLEWVYIQLSKIKKNPHKEKYRNNYKSSLDFDKCASHQRLCKFSKWLATSL